MFNNVLSTPLVDDVRSKFLFSNGKIWEKTEDPDQTVLHCLQLGGIINVNNYLCMVNLLFKF